QYQRITLIVGAVVLLLAIITTPKVIYFRGGKRVAGQYERNATIDPPNAAIRSVGVIGATVLIFFALKGIDGE
ncbi:MAG: hypothetical protein GTN76_15160, partial [Candidatus Aenigmarchaeota archaeon]|nr:hypothetical protein [Candidatus Aenigmarchaeota archaeon]